MAKETFQRSKPHVNVGTIGNAVEDTSGELAFNVHGVEEQGNDPDADILLFMTAPASSSPQQAIVVLPFHDDWQYAPLADAPLVSIDMQLDLLPTRIDGGELQVTLAILQGPDNDAFLGRAGHPPIAPGDTWMTLSDTFTTAGEFAALDGGRNPDLTQPFHFGFAFITDYSGDGLAVRLALDDLRVEITAVPEPASLAMLGALGAAVLLTRRRR